MKRLAIIVGLAAGLAVASPADAQCQSNTWPPSAGTCVFQPRRAPVIINAPTLNVQQNLLVQNTLIEILVLRPIIYITSEPAPLPYLGTIGGTVPDYSIPDVVPLPANTWLPQPPGPPCRGASAFDVGCRNR